MENDLLRSALDLRLMPDWLKESESPKLYSDSSIEGDHGGRPPRNRDFQDDRDRRDPGGQKKRGRSDQGRDRRTGTADRRSGPTDRRAGPGDRRSAPRGGGGARTHDAPRESRPPAVPANVDVEFLPDDILVERLANEIRKSGAAHPLFGLAQLFLQQGDRYAVRIRSKDPATVLHQAGPMGPVALDAQTLGRSAFEAQKHRLYLIEEIVGEPPKGNFSHVARCGLSGTLLGPTSQHTYQPAIRKLYEQRFRKRMSFEDYCSQIEMISDPAAIEEWRNQVARKTLYYAIPTEPPIASAPVSAPEPTPPEPAAENESDPSPEAAAIPVEPVEQAAPETPKGELIGDFQSAFDHFRKIHLPSLLRASNEAITPGTVAQRLPDRSLSAAIRDAWRAETKFPGRIARVLQHKLTQNGVQVFKHKKRYLYASATRPVPFPASSHAAASDRVQAIIEFIAAHPACSRKELASALLPLPPAELPEGTPDPNEENRRALAGDLHFLISSGHVILFQNGSLDLPLSPRPEGAPPTHHDSRQARAQKPTPAAPEAETAKTPGPTSQEERSKESPAPLAEVAGIHEPAAQEAQSAEIPAPTAEAEDTPEPASHQELSSEEAAVTLAEELQIAASSDTEPVPTATAGPDVAPVQ